jgi:hypothetical protein
MYRAIHPSPVQLPETGAGFGIVGVSLLSTWKVMI